MKLRVMIATICAGVFLSAGILYAGNGDLIVNGSLGVGTSSPGQRLTVNGTIESTTGGIKFPDGTTQVTAAGGVANGDFIVNGNLGVGTSNPTSKAEINGNMAVSGNLTVQGTISAPNSGIMMKFYESPEQTITSGGLLTLAHGFGAEPKLVQLWLVCKASSAGYSVGDKVLAPMTVSDSVRDSKGATTYADSTNINVRFGPYTNVFALGHKSTGMGSDVANANWSLVVRAWTF